MSDDDLIADFMRREGVRYIPRGVTNNVLFDELDQRTKNRRNPWDIRSKLRVIIEDRFPRTRRD